jgi:hypothetical protein
MSRLAFNKKEGDFDKIDHQHLSNCWWFLKVFRPEEGKDVRELIKRQLLSRFNGQLLPYRPHIEFKTEIQELDSLGMLHKIEDEFHSYNIIHQGKKIGEIRFPID